MYTIQMVSKITLLSQECVLEVAPSMGTWIEVTFQGQRRG